MKKRALVASGGGAKGVALPALVNKLHEHYGKFDFYGGTSVGALVVSLFAIGLDLKIIDELSIQAMKYMSNSVSIRENSESVSKYKQVKSAQGFLLFDVMLILGFFVLISFLSYIHPLMWICIVMPVGLMFLLFNDFKKLSKLKSELRSINFRHILSKYCGHIKLGDLGKVKYAENNETKTISIEEYDKISDKSNHTDVKELRHFGCYAVRKKSAEEDNDDGDSLVTEYFTSLNESHKDYFLIDVVLASAALPLKFAPVKINGNEYFDGGIRNNTGYSHEYLKDYDASYISYNSKNSFLTKKFITVFSDMLAKSNRSTCDYHRDAKKPLRSATKYKAPSQHIGIVDANKAAKFKEQYTRLIEFYSRDSYEFDLSKLRSVRFKTAGKDKKVLEGSGVQFYKRNSFKPGTSALYLSLIVIAAIMGGLAYSGITLSPFFMFSLIGLSILLLFVNVYRQWENIGIGTMMAFLLLFVATLFSPVLSFFGLAGYYVYLVLCITLILAIAVNCFIKDEAVVKAKLFVNNQADCNRLAVALYNKLAGVEFNDIEQLNNAADLPKGKANKLTRAFEALKSAEFKYSEDLQDRINELNIYSDDKRIMAKFKVEVTPALMSCDFFTGIASQGHPRSI